MSPAGRALRRLSSAVADSASALLTALSVSTGAGATCDAYGPGSYGDCWFGGRTGNHSEVRSGPSVLLRIAMTSGVSVKLSVCVMSPLTISESSGVHGFG